LKTTSLSSPNFSFILEIISSFPAQVGPVMQISIGFVKAIYFKLGVGLGLVVEAVDFVSFLVLPAIQLTLS